MESRREYGAWQSARMNHSSHATPLHPMHLRWQYKVLFTLKQASTHYIILWKNTERMLTWQKAIRLTRWCVRKKTRLVWTTGKIKRLFYVCGQYNISTIWKRNSVVRRFTTGVWFVIGSRLKRVAQPVHVRTTTNYTRVSLRYMDSAKSCNCSHYRVFRDLKYNLFSCDKHPLHEWFERRTDVERQWWWLLRFAYSLTELLFRRKWRDRKNYIT